MAKGSSQETFQEVVVKVIGTKPSSSFITTMAVIEGPQPCPSPSWDPHGIYRVAIVGTKATIQRLRDGAWVTADLEPPEPTLTSSDAPKKANMSMPTGTRTILFMDVSGWSKLRTVDIKRYVETALPQLKPFLEGADFRNTWGDAIVATFTSAKAAAEAALKIQAFFAGATEEQGVPEGLLCRIALHQGEIMLCNNALTGKEDIFGQAVHVAARLEPATAPRHVFCTDVVAKALHDVGGLGPKAWHLGMLELPKKFGDVDAWVVTLPNAEDPTPGLQEYVRHVEPEPSKAPAAPAAVSLTDDECVALLQSWMGRRDEQLNKQAMFFDKVDAEVGLPAGTAKRLLETAAKRWSYVAETKGPNLILFRYNPDPLSPPTPLFRGI